MCPTSSGLYIAFEGGDGSGKSTQVDLLAARLDAVTTREPGATPLGVEIRRLFLGIDGAPVSDRAETLLLAADRAQHMAEIVEPALAEGRHVITDRSAFSSLAYQGAARGLGIEAVRAVNDWALGGRWPDLVILLDAEPAASHQRIDRDLDRFEQEALTFHETVRNAYLEMASADTDRWMVVNADGPIDRVAADVLRALTERGFAVTDEDGQHV